MGSIIWRRDAPPHDVPVDLGHSPCAVAIPARDEARLIGACLRALAAQKEAPPFEVALVLNNCADDTAQQVAQFGDTLPFALHVFTVELPTHLADAAWARRLAMNAAAGLVGADGVVLTTDADSRAEPNWIRTTLDAMQAGVDIVCGFVAPDFNDAPSLAFEALRQGALEFEYSQLTAELITLIDPEPHDPWPNHLIETGANLAVRAEVLAALGGVPHVCPGEDARLVAMARRAGYRVRHAFQPSVTTSSRVRGRAAGGWSEDLGARLNDERATCHPKLEPARATVRRLRLKARLRASFGAARFYSLAESLLPEALSRQRLRSAPNFVEAWGLLEDQSPALQHTPLFARDLEANAGRMRQLVDRVRNQRLRNQLLDAT